MKKTIKILLIIGVCYAVFCWVFPFIGLFGGAGARIGELQRLYDDHRARSEAHTAGLEESLETARRELAAAERDADYYRQLEEAYKAARADNERLETLLSESHIGTEKVGESIRAAIGRAERIGHIIREYRDREHENDQSAGGNDNVATNRVDSPGGRNDGGLDVECYKRSSEMSEWQRWLRDY